MAVLPLLPVRKKIIEHTVGTRLLSTSLLNSFGGGALIEAFCTNICELVQSYDICCMISFWFCI